MRRYSESIRSDAEKLRATGKTYKEIHEMLRVPRSTLCTWLGKKHPGVFDKRAQNKHLADIRILALKKKIEMQEEERRNLEEKIAREIRDFPVHQIGLQKSVLAALYWAEGSKHKGVHGVRFVNTDPNLIEYFLRLLRRCYNIDESRMRIRVHLHHYHNIKKSKEYWSTVTQVPLTQFGKIYIKKRGPTKKFRKNFAGICFINYPDSGVRKEIMEIYRQLHLTSLLNEV
jgi:hypothetical protein